MDKLFTLFIEHRHDEVGVKDTEGKRGRRRETISRIMFHILSGDVKYHTKIDPYSNVVCSEGIFKSAMTKKASFTSKARLSPFWRYQYTTDPKKCRI